MDQSRSVSKWINRHWLAIFNGLVGLFVLGALLAPAAMKAGYTGPAKALYTIYGFTCHQLPQRSYFLFGRNLMYPANQISEGWPEAGSLLQQRAIVGDPDFGYKVAVANRCSAIYPTILFAGLIFSLKRLRVKLLSMKGFIALSFPMALDGGSHFISEITRTGFRDTNVWLQVLSRNAFASDFYIGDALGSANWLLRTLSGALFGIVIVWFAYPILAQAFTEASLLSASGEASDSSSLPMNTK